MRFFFFVTFDKLTPNPNLMIKSKDVMASSPRESSLIGLLPRVSSTSQGEAEPTTGTTPSYFYILISTLPLILGVIVGELLVTSDI